KKTSAVDLKSARHSRCPRCPNFYFHMPRSLLRPGHVAILGQGEPDIALSWPCDSKTSHFHPPANPALPLPWLCRESQGWGSAVVWQSASSCVECEKQVD